MDVPLRCFTSFVSTGVDGIDYKQDGVVLCHFLIKIHILRLYPFPRHPLGQLSFPRKWESIQMDPRIREDDRHGSSKGDTGLHPVGCRAKTRRCSPCLTRQERLHPKKSSPSVCIWSRI